MSPRLRKLLVGILALGLLTGCWDRKEIEERSSVFAMAIDKAMICEYVTRAGQKPARSFVPPGMAGYENAECSPHDLDAAKKILADAGFPNGRGLGKIEVLYALINSFERAPRG